MASIQDERAQLERLERDLLLIFSDLPPDLVRHEVQFGIRAFDGARVRTYVPVLVHKRVKDALRRKSHP